MADLIDSANAFFAHLGRVEWPAIALALLCHLLKVAARTRAWRNILAAAYPREQVGWRPVAGAYVIGAGANALLPAWAGDALKLYAVRQRLSTSTYPGLVGTLAVEPLFDFAIASTLVLWAVLSGAVPLTRVDAFDWYWLERSPLVGVPLAAVVVAVGMWAAVVVSPKLRTFFARAGEGLRVLWSPRRYALHVLPWQTLDWLLRGVTNLLLHCALSGSTRASRTRCWCRWPTASPGCCR
jgi:hypothetical protein